MNIECCSVCDIRVFS